MYLQGRAQQNMIFIASHRKGERRLSF